MDGDPTVEPDLDAFSLFLPLPYRVAIIILLGRSSQPTELFSMLISLGIWAWAINLHSLSLAKIVSTLSAARKDLVD